MSTLENTGAAGAAATATTTTTAAPAPTGSATATATTAAPAATADWTSTFNDDSKGYIQNKGFKDPGALLDSYRNMEKLMGVPQERLLRLPDKADDPAWDGIYNQLGRPKEAKEYDVKVPEGHGDPKFAEWARGTFHKLGMTKAQGDKLASEWNNYVAQGHDQAKQADSQKGVDAENVLKQEWGAALDQNFKIIDRAAHTLGMTDAQLLGLRNAMGPVDAAKFMYSLAQKLGSEDSFVAGGGKNSDFGALTPQAAAQRIEALRGDSEFIKRYTQGDTSAKAEMERLHKFAYPQ